MKTMTEVRGRWYPALTMMWADFVVASQAIVIALMCTLMRLVGNQQVRLGPRSS